jgi:hypothetical protein
MPFDELLYSFPKNLFWSHGEAMLGGWVPCMCELNFGIWTHHKTKKMCGTKLSKKVKIFVHAIQLPISQTPLKI